MSPVRSPIMIMAGGTGGHIFPGLAVAQELATRHVPVVWLGSSHGMECQVVPGAGVPLETIDIRSLRGRGWASLATVPFRLVRALWQAWQVMRKHRPSAVLSMGGFASGPGGVVAWCTRRHLVVHEQNTIPGMTNRILARLADAVFTGFPGTRIPKGQFVGNPVRPEFWDHAEEGSTVVDEQRLPRLLVLGGSQGAAALNEAVPEALANMPEVQRPQVLHQAGQSHAAKVIQNYQSRALDVEVKPFIQDMAAAYRWADLVVCRAGALTLAELAAVGVGSILVPFPHAVDDHQTHNARALEEVGAAVLMPQEELTGGQLAAVLGELLQDTRQLSRMADAARQLSRPNAAHDVADGCLLEQAA